MKKFLLFGVCILLLSGCGLVDSDNKNGSNSSNGENLKYQLDKAFTFDDLELTIGSDYSFTTIDNEYSEHYNETVVKVPITVKNLKDETHGLNMFFYSIYGSQGTKLSTVSTYFMDDCIDWAGDLRADAIYTRYFYFLYDGDGTYTIEFNNFSQKIEFNMEITK